VLEEVAREQGVPFVDNEESFNLLGRDKREYFTPMEIDQHCNAKGYGRMASNICETIMSENLLGSSSGNH
jgi:hypothetical protein